MMKIKIYQVNSDRDEKRIAFAGTSELPLSDIGEPIVDSTVYDAVYQGEVDCKNLEEVYAMFNHKHPEGYRARSLSVSDVVEIIESKEREAGFYFCDSFGFYKVDFEPAKCQFSERFYKKEDAEKISVLLVQPNKYPRMVEIGTSLEAMQKVVGGDIEEYMPFEDEVAIICNEEGKITGLPLNRAIYADPKQTGSNSREMIDIIAGDFFIAFAPIEAESFQSLPQNLADKYREKFKYPERFARMNGEIIAVPFKPVKADRER